VGRFFLSRDDIDRETSTAEAWFFSGLLFGKTLNPANRSLAEQQIRPMDLLASHESQIRLAEPGSKIE
jgi:hypothetical protein